MEIGPWRLGVLGLLKERCLREERCLLNPTHWYADARVASSAPHGRAFQTAAAAPNSTRRYADTTPLRTRDDMQRGILNQNRLQLIII